MKMKESLFNVCIYFMFLVIVFLAYTLISDSSGKLSIKIHEYKLKESRKLASESTIYEKKEDYTLGSAKKPWGNTLIVSIFISDRTTSWNFNSTKDLLTKNDCLENIAIATEYLSNEIKKYDKDINFIYNFNVFTDLYYEFGTSENLVNETGIMYEFQNNLINNNIDVKTLKEKYNADNVVYFYFFNTEYKNQVRPRTIRRTKNTYITNEIINLYVRFGNTYVSPPATYAHEILHTFGANDLYYSSDGISSSYVKYLDTIGSNDIMYTVTSKKEITNEFSELDAYYVGLKDTARDQQLFNLIPSEHLS